MTAALRRAFAWHPPLMTVAAFMILCAALCAAAITFDPREILGAPAWAKPLKFCLSILLYTVTWAWLIAHLPRWRRFARGLGTVIAVTLLTEQVLIVWAAATGTTSHFNVSTGPHAIVWATMAVSITVMYLCTFITSAAVFFLRLPSPAITFAVRAGAIIALFGIGIAFLMTAPTSAQITAPTGIYGAHSVGVDDGGPGVPILGWSTTAGDYRVAHFVGMHALQVLPLIALTLQLVARRVTHLSAASLQLRLTVVAAVVYAAATVLLTLQAALGESVMRPSGAILVAGWALICCGAIAAIAVVVAALRTPVQTDATARFELANNGL